MKLCNKRVVSKKRSNDEKTYNKLSEDAELQSKMLQKQHEWANRADTSKPNEPKTRGSSSV